VRTPKMALVLVAAFATVGCGSPESEADRPVWAAAQATTAAPTPKTTAAAPPPTKTATPRKPTMSPTPKRPAGTRGSSAPPWCQLADLRFSLSLGTGGGTGIAGSVLMTNTSGRRCALTGYLALTWRDAAGAAIPVSINRRPDPQTAHTIAIDPGKRGIVGLNWKRYQSNPPPVSCKAVDATLEIRLPATVDNPHPERKPGKRISWFASADGNMCADTVDMLPVDVMR